MTISPLLEEELVLASSAGPGPLDDVTTVDVATIAGLPLIAFSTTYDLRATTDAAFAAASVTPRLAIEGAEMDAVLRFVERGLGVAIVPAMVLLDRPGLRATRIGEPRLSRTIGIAGVDGVRPSPAASALRAAISSTAALIAAHPDNALTLAQHAVDHEHGRL